MDPTPPISNFISSSTAASVTVQDIEHERLQYVNQLQAKVAELHPVLQDALQKIRPRMREAISAGKLPNFFDGDFFLIAREDFTAGEKLSLRWRGPRREVGSLNDHVYQVEDLRNGQVEDVHGSRFTFYHDPSLEKEAIMSHVFSSETGMQVQHLMRLVESTDGIKVQVRWRGLSESQDSLQCLQAVYEDVPDLLLKLLQRMNAPANLVAKVSPELHLL